MKTITTMALALLSLLASAFSQEFDKKAFDKALTNYQSAMQSESPGIRSSAIYQIAQMKSQRPGEDFSSVAPALVKVAKNDPNPLIRVHAELTISYLFDDDLTKKIKADEGLDMNDFYNKLYNEM
jgi:hypothetical protein